MVRLTTIYIDVGFQGVPLGFQAYAQNLSGKVFSFLFLLSKKPMVAMGGKESVEKSALQQCEHGLFSKELSPPLRVLQTGGRIHEW